MFKPNLYDKNPEIKSIKVEKYSKIVSSYRSIFVDIIIVLFIVLILFLLASKFIRNFRDDIVRLETFSVPQEFEKQTITSIDLTNKLRDELMNIESNPKVSSKLLPAPLYESNIVKNDYVLPNSEISLNSILQGLLEIFPSKQKIVKSQVYRDQNNIFITTKMDEYPPVTFSGRVDSLNSIINQSARYVLEYTKPHILAAYLYAAKKDLDGARKLTKKLILQKLQDPSTAAFAYNLMGVILLDEGKISEAIENFNIGITKNFNSANLHINLGFALASQSPEFFPMAIREFETAIGIDSTRFEAYSNLGNIYYSEKNHVKAIEYYRKATEINSLFPDAYSNWGYVLYEQGSFSEAIEKYNTALLLNPEYATAYANNGLAQFKQNNFKEAKKMFEKAVIYDPCEKESHFYLGLIHERDSNYSEAVIEFTQAVEIDPLNSEAISRLNYLKLKKSPKLGTKKSLK